MAQLQFTLEDLQELVKIGKAEAIDTLTMLGFPTEEMEDGRLNVEVTPNRPDALCVEGVARVLRCRMSGKPAKYSIGKPKVKVTVDKSVADVRPVFGGAVVRGVKMSDSLVRSIMQVQEKLHETLGRKRRKVAIGIHDLGKVTPPFKYFACGRSGVSFVPLDMRSKMTPEEILAKHPKGVGFAHLVGEKCPMITDSKGNILSFPPIINGELTKLTQQSADLFIDTTGTSEEAVRQAVNILVSMLADRGGKIEEITINGKPYPLLEERKWKLPVAESEKLLGVKLGKAKVASLLSLLGHRVVGAGVFVPGYRTDVINTVDLVEDVAIAYGYNNFEPSLPSASTVGREEPEHGCHEVLVGLGYDEVMSWTLSNPAIAKKAKLPQTQAIEIENPLTEDFAVFRTAILPNLLTILGESKNEKLPIRIYEAGSVSVPKLEQRLSLASMHPKASFSEIKGAVLSLAESLGWKVEIKKEEFGPFIAGRCAAIYIGGKKAGFMGEVAPDVLVGFNLEQPVCAAEISI
ncbi:MAG: phenylalanine--tRNA ligase subunit beta [Candidatus Micrarchaeia archaeon]